MSKYEQTLNEIEQSILPAAAAMLDALLDAAQGARPGINAARYADELQQLAAHSERAMLEITAIGSGPDAAIRKRASAA